MSAIVPQDLSSSLRVVATLSWFLFVHALIASERGSLPLQLVRTSLGGSRTVQLSLKLPQAPPDLQSLRLVVERGDSSQRETLAASELLSGQPLLLSDERPGRLAIKAAGLDRAGCIIYGGSVETVVQSSSGAWLVLSIFLKRLDVPLCY